MPQICRRLFVQQVVETGVPTKCRYLLVVKYLACYCHHRMMYIYKLSHHIQGLTAPKTTFPFTKDTQIFQNVTSLSMSVMYSISQEICTRFLLCCALLWLYIDWFSHIHEAFFHDCPSASKATLMNMDKYFMWIHYERLHNHNKAKHNKTVCIFLGIYCRLSYMANII